MMKNESMIELDIKIKKTKQNCNDVCETSEASDSKSHDSGLTESITTCMLTSTYSQDITDGNVSIEMLKKADLKEQKRNHIYREFEQQTAESENASTIDGKLKALSISETVWNSIAAIPKSSSDAEIFAEEQSDLQQNVQQKRRTNLNSPTTDRESYCGQQSQSNPFESDKEEQNRKSIFRVNTYTTSFASSKSVVGPLTALSNTMHNEEQHDRITSAEDHHSSFSETAWDHYQEKYHSEHYSERVDSDAAMRLLEYEDDYRNFIDSLSDSRSSLSAAKNIKTSPAKNESHNQKSMKAVNKRFDNAVDHSRSQRVQNIENERRCKDFPENSKTAAQSFTISTTSKEAEQILTTPIRKLESLRTTSESDTSSHQTKPGKRRRSSRKSEKKNKANTPTNNSSDDKKEWRHKLRKSTIRLKNLYSPKKRQQQFLPEDYTEILNTCRDSLRSLEAVICGHSRPVFSSQCVDPTTGEITVFINTNCTCAPITRFLISTMRLMLDVCNLFLNLRLYKFVKQILTNFYALIKS